VKILLINPPLLSRNPYEPIPFPLGLGYLTAALVRSGHQTALLDACLGPARNVPGNRCFHVGMTIPEILQEVRAYDPDLVGVSVPFTSRLKTAVEIGSALRENFPHLPVIAGGMHATVDPETLLRLGFETVFLGEAEWSLPEDLERRVAGRPAGAAEGIARRAGDEFSIFPQTRHPVNLDELPFPARNHLLRGKFEDYYPRSGGRWIRHGKKVASMITSRGCPYRCTVCSAFRVVGRKYRRRSAANVLEEIDELVQRYRSDVIAFEDDNLTADRERAVRIFEGLASRHPHLTWMTPNGVSIRTLDRELLTIMKKTGCRSVNLAFESGDPYILQEVMKKDLDPEEGRQVRAWCREVGIAVNGYFILGMPGETIESMRRTRDYALSLDLDGIGIFIATPFPGTELYETCKANGWLIPEYTQGDALFQADPDVLHLPLIQTPLLNTAELAAFYEDFQKRFLQNYHRRRPFARWRATAGKWLRGIRGWR
jgi:magnesium-protoporphyrin IX monomethyl ester (oxidative) cyclase